MSEPSTSVKESEGVKRKREEMGAATYARVQRYLITVEYMGTRFLGFQRQKGKRTVQGCLEVLCFRQNFATCFSVLRQTLNPELLIDF